MRTIRMSVKDWIGKVKDNPIQRDTERHAAKAKHLLEPNSTHAAVSAAELPNGKLVKLDGHTRALLWQRGQVEAPHELHVNVFPVASLAEAEELYKTFDSKDALENQRDKISGAFRRYNFVPQSGFLKGGSITSGLRIAYAVLKGFSANSANADSGRTPTPSRAAVVHADTYTMVSEFAPELMSLDAFLVTGNPPKIHSGTLAAFLLSYRKYGHKVTPFWQGVFGGGGSKIAGEMDAIQALCELILSRRGRSGAGNAVDMCNRALTAVEKFLEGETLHAIPRPMDTTGYLNGAEKPTERLIKARDIQEPATA